nr:MAG TPA_asm: KilAC domain protein [Caudoviricetes sp.]
MENFNNEPTLFDSMGKGILVSKENLPTETCETAQSALKCFENADFGKVRVLGDSENPLFCLADICKILNLDSVNKVANAIKAEFELGELNSASFDTGFGIKNFTMLRENELYFILMRSKSPKAKPFRRWVCDEVLPSIRKIGKYEVQTHAIPKTYAEALLEAGRLALENERLLAQAQKNAPLVEFAENVAHSVNSISVNEFAKILGIKDFGEKKLFAYLRENSFLNAFNQPYQKYLNLGLFELKEGTYATQKGLNTYTQTLITGKGQIYLSEKIEKFLQGGEND